jgi:hypothetical protein
MSEINRIKDALKHAAAVAAVLVPMAGAAALAEDQAEEGLAQALQPAEGAAEEAAAGSETDTEDTLADGMLADELLDEEGGDVLGAAPAQCPPVASVQEEVPSTDLLDTAFVDNLKTWLDVPVVRLTLESRNEANASLGQSDIDALDKQWRAETESDDQPLITAVLNSPLSTYLLRVQAGQLGLYSEIFVIDAKGLNAGQSSVTSDYWQGDEAKFQKTYDAGPSAVFIDEAEYHEATDTWRAQVNVTLTDDGGDRIGAATIEVNLTELARRSKAGI